MTPRILEATYVRDFIIHLRFSDGTTGDVDLKDELEGVIFDPLKDIFYFKQFDLNHDIHTITWPNGADFAPEFLHEKLQVPAESLRA